MGDQENASCRDRQSLLEHELLSLCLLFLFFIFNCDYDQIGACKYKIINGYVS